MIIPGYPRICICITFPVTWILQTKCYFLSQFIIIKFRHSKADWFICPHTRVPGFLPRNDMSCCGHRVCIPARVRIVCTDIRTGTRVRHHGIVRAHGTSGTQKVPSGASHFWLHLMPPQASAFFGTKQKGFLKYRNPLMAAWMPFLASMRLFFSKFFTENQNKHTMYAHRVT